MSWTKGYLRAYEPTQEQDKVERSRRITSHYLSTWTHQIEDSGKSAIVAEADIDGHQKQCSSRARQLQHLERRTWMLGVLFDDRMHPCLLLLGKKSILAELDSPWMRLAVGKPSMGPLVKSLVAQMRMQIHSPDANFHMRSWE